MMNMRQVYRHAPDHALAADPFVYCPLCGQLLDQQVLDNRSRRVCTGCGYVNFRNPAPTVSLLIIQGEQVLLGKRSGGPGQERWATPSGYIELDEDFLTTAIREAREETGLEVEVVSILNVTSSFFPPEQHFFNVYLLARVTGGRLAPGDDMGDLRWFPLGGSFPEMAFQEDCDMLARFCQPGCPGLPVDAEYAKSRA